MIHLSQRFSRRAALLLAFLLFGGLTVFNRWAWPASEPMEPLPVALPARHPPVAPSGGGYVGAASCAECHPAEYRHWQGSQHAQAMQPATEPTVLGDFQDASFAYAGITSTFFRRDGQFVVRTDGPDGSLQDYEIAYTLAESGGHGAEPRRAAGGQAGHGQRPDHHVTHR